MSPNTKATDPAWVAAGLATWAAAAREKTAGLRRRGPTRKAVIFNVEMFTCWARQLGPELRYLESVLRDEFAACRELTELGASQRMRSLDEIDRDLCNVRDAIDATAPTSIAA